MAATAPHRCDILQKGNSVEVISYSAPMCLRICIKIISRCIYISERRSLKKASRALGFKELLFPLLEEHSN